MRTYLHSCVLLMTILWASTSMSGSPRADTILVPEDVIDIGLALASADPGDSVSVAPGTYHENLTWPPTQGLYLFSRAWREATIAAAAEAPVISIQTPVDSTTVIEGFVIRDGQAAHGGGIFCSGSSPRIDGNFIRDNGASLAGAGIACLSASPVIVANRLQGNVCAFDGGGIFWDEWSAPSVRTDSIATCEAQRGGGICGLGDGMIHACYITECLADDGGGIYASGAPLIIGCTVTSCVERGIYCTGPATVRGNEICHNRGGLRLYMGATGLVEDNTIEHNHGGDGAGIHIKYCSPTIRGNRIRHNDGSGGIAGGIFIEWCSPTIEYNEVTYNRTDYEASGIYCCEDTTRLHHNLIAHNISDGVDIGSGIFI